MQVFLAWFILKHKISSPFKVYWGDAMKATRERILLSSKWTMLTLLPLLCLLLSSSLSLPFLLLPFSLPPSFLLMLVINCVGLRKKIPIQMACVHSTNSHSTSSWSAHPPFRFWRTLMEPMPRKTTRIHWHIHTLSLSNTHNTAYQFRDIADSILWVIELGSRTPVSWTPKPWSKADGVPCIQTRNKMVRSGGKIAW